MSFVTVQQLLQHIAADEQLGMNAWGIFDSLSSASKIVQLRVTQSGLAWCQRLLLAKKQQARSLRFFVPDDDLLVLNLPNPGYVQLVGLEARHYASLTGQIADLEAKEHQLCQQIIELLGGEVVDDDDNDDDDVQSSIATSVTYLSSVESSLVDYDLDYHNNSTVALSDYNDEDKQEGGVNENEDEDEEDEDEAGKKGKKVVLMLNPFYCSTAALAHFNNCIDTDEDATDYEDIDDADDDAYTTDDNNDDENNDDDKDDDDDDAAKSEEGKNEEKDSNSNIMDAFTIFENDDDYVCYDSTIALVAPHNPTWFKRAFRRVKNLFVKCCRCNAC